MKRTLDTGRLLLSTNVYPIPGLMEDMQLAKLRGGRASYGAEPLRRHLGALSPDGNPELGFRYGAAYSCRLASCAGPSCAAWRSRGDWTANTTAPLFQALADYEAPRNDFLDWPAKSTP
ncbi:hypothetical protein MRX96_040312 [Rhipicephalus microplus]